MASITLLYAGILILLSVLLANQVVPLCSLSRSPGANYPRLIGR